MKKLTEQERAYIGLTCGPEVHKLLKIHDAQHLALRNVRLLAEALDVEEDDDSDNIDCTVDCDLIALDLLRALNGLGCDE
jgi:hypothetical protein